MTYVLVLQWRGSTEQDYEDLVAMEDRLEEQLGADAVDGHDFGSGEMNIFLVTDEPAQMFLEARAALSGQRGWDGVRAAYRDLEEDVFTNVWPEGGVAFTVV